jgi:Fe-S-cluster containining protein
VKNGQTSGQRYLAFRCTGCGNCCKDPLLPLTDTDLSLIQGRTGDHPSDFVRWVTRHEIQMDDEPEAFVVLRQGKRVMTLRHGRRGCHFLGDDDRCTIYEKRPLGCRIFPFDPTFDKQGSLRRLKLIDATDCQYELDGRNDPQRLRSLHARYENATTRYHERVAEWNRVEAARRRKGRAARTAREFLEYLGFPS